MQSSRAFLKGLREIASEERYLFTPSDLAALLPEMSDTSFKSLLSRLTSRGELLRVCRGLYRPAWINPSHGWTLYHAAARLRAGTFTYLSLESVLSEAGWMSQIPMQSIFLMTRGRGGDINCGSLGRICFTHTTQNPEDVWEHLVYDPKRKLWVATAEQALRDLRRTRRNLDLLLEEFHESV
ncbi:MAG: type IV toxin-antitoxin system AbiEi family antitoxin [Kiritimatiellia bacterium]